MRSMGSLLDTGLAETTPERDPLPWIKQKAAEVTKQAEQHDAAQALTPRVRHLIDEAVELEVEQARSAGATGYIAHFSSYRPQDQLFQTRHGQAEPFHRSQSRVWRAVWWAAAPVAGVDVY
ncbi:hypothetical protein [Pseudomonas aeruginosa]|uniref:hypothetical protein n=1 Tax=Pseudomonas aeruginosa TaxID=287 RepID=UPI001F4B3A77|nr:hypothetical protein [Pseudomonas aeruginosa]MCS7697576.1 hypothetical protein [Pseudomonas aeruginosa]